MKKFAKIASAALSLAMLVNVTACKSTEDKVVEMTAQEVVADMGNGWNLGNTMDACGNWLSPSSTVYDYEKCWGAPTTTKEIIDGIKSAGFNSVRIPVAWSNMISDDGSYTIDPTYFARVDEIVNYVLSDDIYAIVNIHWDGGWWEDFGSTDEAEREETMKRYKAMWTQIAGHYKDYSYKLILESANEELGDAFEKANGKDGSYELVNKINQTFVDLVRGMGGKNANRFLLIAGYNTSIDNTCDDRYKMPTDTIKNHLMVSVHYYTPSTYCIAASETNSWGYMGSWGTDKDKEEMRSYFEKMKKFSDQGYGVIIGEYGVVKVQGDLIKVPKEGTTEYLKLVVELAKENGYCAMLWDGGNDGWYDRTKCAIAYDDIAAIYKAK